MAELKGARTMFLSKNNKIKLTFTACKAIIISFMTDRGCAAAAFVYAYMAPMQIFTYTSF